MVSISDRFKNASKLTKKYYIMKKKAKKILPSLPENHLRNCGGMPDFFLNKTNRLTNFAAVL